MTEHVFNLFEIQNTQALASNYRLVELDGPFAEDDLADQNLSTLCKRIAFREAMPVAIVRQGGVPRLAIPADRTLAVTEYQLTPDLVTLRPQRQTHSLRFDKLTLLDESIALSFLGFSFRSPLRDERDLWASSTSTYLFRRPANFRHDRRDVDVFEGFSFRLVRKEQKFFLSVALTVKYVDNQWLTERYALAEIRNLKGRRFLYHFGNAWYVIQLLGLAGKSVAEQRFTLDASNEVTTVLAYTREKCGDRPPNWIRQLDPKSPAITYQSNNEKKRHGAAALCKAMLSTDDPAVQAVHGGSIMSPENRFACSADIVERFFQGRKFGNATVHVSTTPHSRPAKVFPIPAIRFGQGKHLTFGNGSQRTDVRLEELGRARMGLLLDVNGGMAETSVMDAQYAIFPSGFHIIAEDFRERQEKTVRQFLHAPYQLKPIVFDEVKTRNLRDQVQSISDALEIAEVAGGHGLLVLPENAHSHLHNYIKRKLRDTLQVQCVSATKVREFYEERLIKGERRLIVPSDREGKFTSYLRYTALGLLLVNRQSPFCIDDQLPYDLSIGLDVYRNTAAFSFVHEGGKHYFVTLEQSKQREKLLRQQIRDVIARELRDQLRVTGRTPKSILLRRDGRSFHCEWLGFRDAIQTLVSERVLHADVRFGIAEIHKTFSLGMRLVERYRAELRNPRIGSWEPLNEREGILCNTGFPFKLRGTVKPLLVRLAWGDLNLAQVLQDTFWLSLLCWPVPDRCMRLPIDLKLCDDHLRAVCGDADEDEAVYGEEKDDMDELDVARLPVSYQ